MTTKPARNHPVWGLSMQFSCHQIRQRRHPRAIPVQASNISIAHGQQPKGGTSGQIRGLQRMCPCKGIKGDEREPTIPTAVAKLPSETLVFPDTFLFSELVLWGASGVRVGTKHYQSNHCMGSNHSGVSLGVSIAFTRIIERPAQVWPSIGEVEDPAWS